MSDARIDLTMQLREPNELQPRFGTALVPRNSISGRALVAVVAIMTFLVSLTTGAAVLVTKAAGEWQSDISREITIQIMPAPGRDLDTSVNRAVAIARAISGVVEVRPYSKEESMKLLEPWLGSGISLSELPVPRLIVIKIAADTAPDLGQLRRVLADQVPGAIVDDHRGWIDRMRAMAGTAVAVGVCILILMFAATVLSVAFPRAARWRPTRRSLRSCILSARKTASSHGIFSIIFWCSGSRAAPLAAARLSSYFWRRP